MRMVLTSGDVRSWVPTPKPTDNAYRHLRCSSLVEEQQMFTGEANENSCPPSRHWRRETRESTEGREMHAQGKEASQIKTMQTWS